MTTGCKDIAYCLVGYFILSHPVHFRSGFKSCMHDLHAATEQLRGGGVCDIPTSQGVKSAINKSRGWSPWHTNQSRAYDDDGWSLTYTTIGRRRRSTTGRNLWRRRLTTEQHNLPTNFCDRQNRSLRRRGASPNPVPYLPAFWRWTPNDNLLTTFESVSISLWLWTSVPLMTSLYNKLFPKSIGKSASPPLA